MHDVTLESDAAVTDHFADAFVRQKTLHAYNYMTLWRCNDARKFDADAISFEKSSVRKWVFNV